MPSHEALSFRVVAMLAAPLVIALLACNIGDFNIDLGDGGWDWGDGGLFGGGCKSDDECEAGQCCTGFLTASCTNTISTDPTQSSCSTLGDDHDALCTCVPPQSAPICPGWYMQAPFVPECTPNAYAKCAVSCVDRTCYCATDETFVPTNGIDVPSCPPPDWTAVCPSSDAGDGG